MHSRAVNASKMRQRRDQDYKSSKDFFTPAIEPTV